jgi:hypothetical protein
MPNVVMMICLEWLDESPKEKEGCTIAKENMKPMMFQSMKTGYKTHIQEVHGFLIG